ncbi:MAG TPA: AMP-binding protein [Terracidiphilus sp.]|nr:AMP-binding protein [Terracidiphilus sp.]
MRDHLGTLLEDFRRYGSANAVVRFKGNRRHVTTYVELARLAGRFAALLKRRGIGQGERVLLWAENGADWMGAFYGCMLRGVLAVPLDPGGRAEFAARVAADVKPKLAVGDLVLMAKLEQAATDLGFARLAFEEWGGELTEQELGPLPGLNRESPLEILFTSGTTGDPKGVVLTHGNVLASIGPVEEGSQPYLPYLKLVAPLRILHTLPLSHVFGQTMGLWIPPIYKSELHFESRLAAPRLVETIRRERISVLTAVPRVAAILRNHLETIHPELAERIASTGKIGPARRWWRFLKIHREFGLKFWALVSGGGALAGPLERFWNAMGFVVIQGYGMTETTALITLNHPFHVAQGTVGKPLAGREVKLGPDGEVLVRGAMISGAIWQGGKLQRREDEWLATGDLAEREPSGDLKFLGRKSEVIVTSSGLNVHPEDLEAAVEEQPGVMGCAVVPMETPNGPEACAVLAFRGGREQAAMAIENANKRLAEFQRVRRWTLWPEPDLPRTSTGKVRRKAVQEWLGRVQEAAAKGAGEARVPATGAAGKQKDWLLALIEQISGEAPPGGADELRLSEDLHLDSLGRVQLAAALEERMGGSPGGGMLESVATLGELRKLAAGNREPADGTAFATPAEAHVVAKSELRGAPAQASRPEERAPASVSPPTATGVQLRTNQPQRNYIYPRWPLWAPVRWVRAAFTELIMQPVTWLLIKPRVTWSRAVPRNIDLREPMLIVCNHITSYDGALVQYALPGRMRGRLAIAMSGEMLEDFRHARRPEGKPGAGRFFPLGPPAYFLATLLFNVFPLPRLRSFQPSFEHTGLAMDRGYHVLVFPEGALSQSGYLARFRPGIGLLAKLCNTPVLPVALRGVGQLKREHGGWFRTGRVEVRIGEPVKFSPLDSEAQITERLHDKVARLLGE